MGSTVVVGCNDSISFGIQAWSEDVITSVILLQNGDKVKEWNPNDTEFNTSYSQQILGDAWFGVGVYMRAMTSTNYVMKKAYWCITDTTVI
jgi:hypothetical protein